MRSVILIFLDGVGIGKREKSNPFFNGDFYFAEKLFGISPSLETPYLKNNDGMFVFPSDATLGIGGLPQSGTGQTAIFCGENASEIVGKHFGPFPHSKLLPVLEEKNIYNELKQLGLTFTFANAYPPRFFKYLAKGHTRTAATTKAALFAGLKLNGIDELKKGMALSHEIDNSRLKNKLNLPVEVISPEESAENLIKLGEKLNFVFYEYFLTDHWGHGREKNFYKYGIQVLNKFLLSTIRKLTENQTLIICSDHGNFEDLNTKSHTINPSFTFVAGKDAKQFANEVKSISDIKEAVKNLLIE